MNNPETEAAAPAAAPAAPPAPSPGALLRQARERAGLGTEDLAAQLKLAKGVIEALEHDDFVTLSEPVYVRGYYRKIAKVLPVGEAELINAYHARVKPAPAGAPLRRLPLAGGVAAGTSRHLRGPGMGVAVVAILAAGVLFALVTREPPQRLADIAQLPVTAPRPEPVAAPPPADLEPVPGPADAAATAPATASADPGAGVEAAGSTDTPVSQAAPAPVAAPAPDVSPAPAAVAKQLVLDFSEASFVRVEDQQGRTLRIGLVRGGERHAFDGEPPYTVFLGNAQNVKAYFAGAPVDFSASVNAQNDTARFTVP